MILVDTSVWIDHLRSNDTLLVEQLQTGNVLTHPFIIGELALGNLQHRDVVLEAMMGLPRAVAAADHEVMQFLEQNRLFGQGIGFVDVHLLAAVKLTPDATIWTRDKRLLVAASWLGIAQKLSH